MINNKLKIKNTEKKFLLNSLFKSKNFYGESLNKTKKEILPFIYGIRHGYSIINLKYTIPFLKRSLNLLKHSLKKKKNILIIGNSIDMEFLLNKQYIKNNKNIILFKDEWVNGTLTNSKNIPSILKNKKINLVVVLHTSVKQEYLFTEIYNSKIPLITFADTSSDIKYVNYPIITNCRNIQSVFFLMYLIRKII